MNLTRLLATVAPALLPKPPAFLLPPTLIAPTAFAGQLSGPDDLLLATGTHRPKRKRPAERPRPEQSGTRISEEWLQQLNSRDCLWRFRMTADEIVDLKNAMQIPAFIRTRSRYVFTGIEALCLMLARFRTPGDMYQLTVDYDRSQSSISEVVNWLVQYLDDKWAHLFEFEENEMLSPEKLEEYAQAVHDHGAPVHGVWGFIDCTIRRICRPSRFQRQAYNGHKKYHALKFQLVMLPNGMFGLMYGPVEGRRHDCALLEDSRLLEECEMYARRDGVPDDAPAEQHFFQLFGDAAYGLSPQLIGPYAGSGNRTQEERRWNAAMGKLRIEVEHGFATVTNNWPFLNASWKMHLFGSPVGRYYRVGLLLTNAITCFRYNQVSQGFECVPPSLDEYFV